jgi:hypothetical protein
MKLFRYRKPSPNRVLGITRVKRQVKHSLGISQIESLTRPSRIKQRMKQKVGLYSPIASVVRNTAKGKFPSLFGLFNRKK